MKKILVIAAVLFCGLTAYAQKQAGSILIGGQFSLSTNSQKSDFKGTETTEAKSLDFSIRPSVHYFLTDEFAIGGSLGYNFNKVLANPIDELHNKTGIFSISPSLIYNMKISEKFSYTPELFVDLGFASYKYELKENTNKKFSGFSYGIGLELMKFEFMPTSKIGLTFSCGELSYYGKSEDKENEITKKQSSFKLGFNLAPALGFRYYL